MSRPYIDKDHPTVYKHLVAAARASRTASEEVGVGLDVIELVNVRVSQINGCSACLSVHAPAARKHGVSQLQLDLLPVWRDVDVFTPVHKAALALAEAITTPHGGAGIEEAVEAAREVLTGEQISAVEWGATLINTFNRISIASGHPVVRPPEHAGRG